ncbi:Zn-dependent exopeptidase, partial [Ramicandelaber brevisporus]
MSAVVISKVPEVAVHATATAAATISAKDAYDCAVVVFTDAPALVATAQTSSCKLAAAFASLNAIDASAADSVTISALPAGVFGGRVVFSPTGSLADDVDDVRKFGEAATAGFERAIAAGAKRPVLVLADAPIPCPAHAAKQPSASNLYNLFQVDDYKHCVEVALLGALQTSYVPLVTREHISSTKSSKALEKLDGLGLVVLNAPVSNESGEKHITQWLEKIALNARVIESGRRVMRDMGYADSERMTPAKCAEYILQVLAPHSNLIKTKVIGDYEVLKKEYPLLAAVSQCANGVARHHGHVVELDYRSPDQSQVKEDLYFIGKGVTFDTGGQTIKTDGHSRAMSRDKLGACSLAGFMLAVALLKPTHVNIHCKLGFVQNSIGSNAFLTDQVLVSRAGVRLLITDTDGEGRLVMSDLLCECKEMALAKAAANPSSPPARLFTVATLTGHAIRAMGQYGIVLDNGPARRAGVSRRIAAAGHLYADPYEISSLRREDLAVIQSSESMQDIAQANGQPSTQTARGHQMPAAVMIEAAGLRKHGLIAQVSGGKDLQVAYTHVDIAASAEE